MFIRHNSAVRSIPFYPLSYREFEETEGDCTCRAASILVKQHSEISRANNYLTNSKLPTFGAC